MIWFIAPLTVVAAKMAVSSQIANAIHGGVHTGVKQAGPEIKNLINKKTIWAMSNITFNLLALLTIIYVAPLVAEREISIFAITSVYLATVIHGLYNIASSSRNVFKFIRVYRFDLKSFLYSEIYKESYLTALRKAKFGIENTFILFKPFVYIFGDSPHDIAKQVAHRISDNVVKTMLLEIRNKIILLAFFVTAYAVISRFVVTPYLLKTATEMEWREYFFYPLIFSFEYFKNLYF